jgi:DnaJ-class molecular chaperone
LNVLGVYLLEEKINSHASLFFIACRYSVLGIKRGATKNEVSAAFRKEMLKHHPDTQVSASEAEKARASERAKYISEAYRKVKADMKR